MLSPEALLEDSLAVSALTLSVCSRFINTAEEHPPQQPQPRKQAGVGWVSEWLPDPGSSLSASTEACLFPGRKARKGSSWRSWAEQARGGKGCCRRLEYWGAEGEGRSMGAGRREGSWVRKVAGGGSSLFKAVMTGLS